MWAPTIFIAMVLFSFVAPAVAETTLYRVSSKDMGVKEFDITVTETVRNPHTSILRIPGYADRSAAASRWLMCAYTDLAIKRGFKFWAVVSPDPPSEDILIGFPKSEQEDQTKTLGPQFTDENTLAAGTKEMSSFCGM